MKNNLDIERNDEIVEILKSDLSWFNDSAFSSIGIFDKAKNTLLI